MTASTATDLSTWTDRAALAAVLMREQGFDDSTIAFYRERSGTGSNREYWAEALETADAILAVGFTRASVIERAALTEALETADNWSEFGSSEVGRATWSGIRDTLRVVLGITTERPRVTGPGTDIAADTILGAQYRLNRKTR